MPKSKHRKNHKAKAAQRKAEHELKRHRTKAFAAKIEEAIKIHQFETQNGQSSELTTMLTPVGGTTETQIFPSNYNIY
jgi:hypothetical protein